MNFDIYLIETSKYMGNPFVALGRTNNNNTNDGLPINLFNETNHYKSLNPRSWKPDGDTNIDYHTVWWINNQPGIDDQHNTIALEKISPIKPDDNNSIWTLDSPKSEKHNKNHFLSASEPLQRTKKFF